jgi:hypothetical protein
MAKLKNQQILEYFSRSYKAVDGLWFMKVEEKFGFDNALELDDQVWKIMSKIQARMIKSFLELKNGPNSLLMALIKKFELEGFQFESKRIRSGFKIIIYDCPWYNLMVKSGREQLAKKVGNTICNTEYRVWISELAKGMRFELETQKCEKSDHCTFNFLIK